MLTTLPLEPLFRRDLWMQYKRRGGWNKQAAGLTNQANFSSGKKPCPSLPRIGFWTENVHFKSCQKLACASWSIFFSAVAVRILERRPELKLLASLLNRQTKAKLLTRRQNLTNSANRNLKRSATQTRKTPFRCNRRTWRAVCWIYGGSSASSDNQALSHRPTHAGHKLTEVSEP